MGIGMERRGFARGLRLDACDGGSSFLFLNLVSKGRKALVAWLYCSLLSCVAVWVAIEGDGESVLQSTDN